MRTEHFTSQEFTNSSDIFPAFREVIHHQAEDEEHDSPDDVHIDAERSCVDFAALREEAIPDQDKSVEGEDDADRKSKVHGSSGLKELPEDDVENNYSDHDDGPKHCWPHDPCFVT